LAAQGSGARWRRAGGGEDKGGGCAARRPGESGQAWIGLPAGRSRE